MSYRVGSWVKIKANCKERTNLEQSLGWLPGMNAFVGKRYKVKSIIDGCIYELLGTGFTWAESWLEPAKIQEGDIVKVKSLADIIEVQESAGRKCLYESSKYADSYRIVDKVTEDEYVILKDVNMSDGTPLQWASNLLELVEVSENITPVKVHVNKKKNIDKLDKPSAKVKVKKKDNVNHPEHYSSGKFDCIDAMIEAFGEEAVYWFCICNAFKYLWRHKKKNKSEDLEKANWYENYAIKLYSDIDK